MKINGTFNVLICIIFVLYSKSSFCQSDTSKFYKAAFQITQPDYTISPYTGMTRNEWIKCGTYILEGAFQYVKNLEDPMYLPKFPGKSYPYEGNEKAPKDRRSAAIFEAISRTYNIAAPLLNENPDLVINNIKISDYYQYHFLQLLTNPDCDYYIGEPRELQQQTCELGNLALWNIVVPNVFWNKLTKPEQEKVAGMMKKWAEARTNTHNWRWFNVMMLTFLELNGYAIDKTLMTTHIDNLILHYAGEGWYRDSGYDYYTIHVFHLFGTIWVENYGKKFFPERAEIISKQFDDFQTNYAMIFSKKGEVNMYGRSALYRLGASVGMVAAHLYPRQNYTIKVGEARRVASGALLQFVTHPNFFNNGIPSLGFYGSFEHCIQPYSCSASPYWMFSSFAALTLPANHPFWTSKEDLGSWKTIDNQNVVSKYWSGAGILASNHGNTGTSELRPGKSEKIDPNYTRLVYNTSFPWEADAGDGVVSAAVTMHIKGEQNKAMEPIYIDEGGYVQNVLYRQAIYKVNNNRPGFVDMATIIVPGGEIRIERLRKTRKTVLNLGHFSLANIDGFPKMTTKKIDGKQSTIVNNSSKQLAVTNYMGWQTIDTLQRIGFHPETLNSTLLYLGYQDTTYEHGPVEILISVLLHKNDTSDWKDDELQPILTVEPLKKNYPIHLGGMVLTLKNKKKFVVDFKNIDGISTRH